MTAEIKLRTRLQDLRAQIEEKYVGSGGGGGGDSKYELEARFTSYKTFLESESERIRSYGLSLADFYFLLNFYTQKYGLIRPIVTNDFSYQDRKNPDVTYRKTLRSGVDGKDLPPPLWIRKERITQFEKEFFDEYGFRLVLSREVELTEPEIKDLLARIGYGSLVETNRTKHRYSYLLGKEENNRADLTEVIMGGKTYYELEVEMEGQTRDNNYNLLILEIINTLKLLQQTNQIYTRREQQELIDYMVKQDPEWKYVPSRYGPRYIRPVLARSMLVEARDLKLRDMVWGGLLGCESGVRGPLPPEREVRGRGMEEKFSIGYKITHKADGYRKLLVFAPNGIWLLMPPFEYDLIMSTNSMNEETKKFVADLEGFVFDGESIPEESRNGGKKSDLVPTQKYFYLIFDTLMADGSTDIQKQYHSVRMESSVMAQKIKDESINNLIYISTKAFRSFNTPEQFFKLNTEMLEEREFLPYKEDGFMYIPEQTVYNPKSGLAPLRDRVLTRYPDICKWKPLSKRTIDFRIEKKQEGGREYWQLQTGAQNEPFVGSRINPSGIGGGRAEIEPLTANLSSGAIVEYSWGEGPQIQGVRGEITPHWSAIRIRRDKLFPNKTEIALDIWDNIHDPVTEETLQGTSLKLLRRYHNRIKRELFTAFGGGTKILLDIGSGRGGDVEKWRENYRFIYAVEPNAEHRKILETRIETFGLQKQVLIVPYGGEKTKEIFEYIVKNQIERTQRELGRKDVKKEVEELLKVDVVSLMFSLSFFWKDEGTLNGLKNTIGQFLKPGGNIIFTTINGDAVRQLFRPSFGVFRVSDISFNQGKQYIKYDEKGDTLTFNQGTLKLNPEEREVNVQYYGTIVGGKEETQKEWLVNIYELERRDQWLLTEIYRMDQELFLNAPEALLTKLYSYGYFTRVGDDKARGTALLREKRYDIMLARTMPDVRADVWIQTFRRTPLVARPWEKYSFPTCNPYPIDLGIKEVKTGGETGVEKKVEAKGGAELKGVEGPEKKVELKGGEELEKKVEAKGVEIVEKNGETELVLEPLTTNVDLGIPIVLNVPWWPLTEDAKLVRIPSYGGSNGFGLFHSILRATDPRYRENNSLEARREYVRKIREQLAQKLETKDPGDGGKTYYETTAQGQFPILARQGWTRDSLGQVTDFSLPGLQRKIANLTEPLSYEFLDFLSRMFQIGIIVFYGTTQNLYLEAASIHDWTQPIVLLLGNGFHYELLGISKQDGSVQTLFYAPDPLIIHIRRTLM